jgi:hypothetical protein
MGLPSQMSILCIYGIILVLFFSSLNASALADSINPNVYSKDSAPYGIPYKDWIARWWQWTISIPKQEHPRDNYSPEKCAARQQGPVWFLADVLTGKEDRTCTVPSGKAILAPMLTGECGYDVPSIKNDEDLRSCSTAGDEYGAIEASLDGVKLQNLQQYRTQSGFFNITIPTDNIYDNRPGTFKAFSDGFFVFLQPLPVGKHDLHLKVNVLNPFESQYNYSAEWTYHLIIKP